MKKVVYSPDAIEKIQKIERQVRAEYGDNTARKVKKAITARIRSLQTLEGQGVSMYDLFGVTPDYRRLFVAHNYVFYLIEGETIQIVNLYHEKEDFMYKLFGVISTDEEAEAYWDDIDQNGAL